MTALPGGRRITHAIFDNDGTISTLREGWERIMEPMMIRAILGPGWKQAGQDLYERVRGRVRDYIDATTGVQTLVQMQGLVEMVREFGVVPAAEVKDEAGYKAVYNEELLAMVKAPAGQARRGELSVEDYTLKGSLAFLRSLRAAGVRALPRERHRPGGCCLRGGCPRVRGPLRRRDPRLGRGRARRGEESRDRRHPLGDRQRGLARASWFSATGPWRFARQRGGEGTPWGWRATSRAATGGTWRSARA